MRLPTAGLIAAMALLAACERPEPEPLPPFALEPVAFTALDGWTEDAASEAVVALLRSCAPILRREPDAAFAAEALAGTNADWQAACRAAQALPLDGVDGQAADVDGAARAFFESWFQPYRVLAEGESEGLFTGYYEPLLGGSLAPLPGGVPLRRAPGDIITVDLSQFAEDLEGRRVRGRVNGDRLLPYFDRGEIERGALDGRELELVWVNDPIEKFFLQIQGSGLVQLEDGRLVRVGYADQNGRAYRPIGRDLIEMGELTREAVSLQSIDAWLRANPDRAEALMDKNPSYVFFQLLGEAEELAGPLGAQGVPLLPGRSLAVDRRFIPYGAPVWLETTAPYPDGPQAFKRLMIAQDTGGAIRGGVRGDVFWGSGDLAASVAGHMNSRGRYYLFLPRAAVPTN
jgi:membrane-bound lytic murein transglycosylase A